MISINRVTFNYRKNCKSILNNINLERNIWNIRTVWGRKDNINKADNGTTGFSKWRNIS